MALNAGFLHIGLKGVPLFSIRSVVNKLIRDLTLEDKRHTNSAALSGGQKRKLCLAIAFIGESKVIFLGIEIFHMEKYVLIIY